MLITFNTIKYTEIHVIINIQYIMQHMHITFNTKTYSEIKVILNIYNILYNTMLITFYETIVYFIILTHFIVNFIINVL